MIKKFKIPIIIILISLGSIFIYQIIQTNSPSGPNQQITESDAIDIVKNIPEVQEFIKNSDEYNIEATLDENTNSWIVWVYYLKEEALNTFTFGYFEVDKNTGEAVRLD